jgi:hypothetical protein
MQPAISRIGVLVAGVLTASLCLYPQSPASPPSAAPSQTAPKKELRPNEPQGLPPRLTPAEYQAHVKAGTVTIGAEFVGHFVRTAQKTLTTEDYVSVEVGLFGEPGAKLTLSPGDFTLRINDKKVLPSLPYGLVVRNVKDPEWEPPELASSKKSKTSLNSGGGQDEGPPPIVHVPIELQRAMAEQTKLASLSEGDRTLPQAGLLYFEYRGKDKSIHSVQLTYNGPAGKATVALQP